MNSVEFASLEARFMAKVSVATGDSCWPWKGAKSGKTGKGSFDVFGSRQLAHRVSYMLFVGPIPDGMCVCHRCDVPACVNPSHLFLGTQADNLADMKEKDRHAKGSKSGRSKLNEDEVRTIRSLLTQGKTQDSIARQFGVVRTVISRIGSGRIWTHA